MACGNDNGVHGSNVTNLNLVDVSMVAHSTIRPNAFQCSYEQLRYGLPVSMGCSYPYGMPNQLIGGLTNVEQLKIKCYGVVESGSPPIPPEIGNLKSLKKLYLERCGLTGQIPAWLLARLLWRSAVLQRCLP